MNVEAIRILPLLTLPELVLCLTACVLFVGGTFQSSRRLWGTVALVGLLFSMAGLTYVLNHPEFMAVLQPGAIYNGAIFPDSVVLIVRAIVIVGGIVLVLFSWDEIPDRQSAEYFGSLLFALAGVSLTALANDLVTMFVALEMISIPTYVLLYLPRHDDRAQEAALKYFLLSIFSSALLLFGFSYLYGLSGTTYLPDVVLALTGDRASTLAGGSTGLIPAARSVAVTAPALAMVAVVMVVAGLGFKITAVPFHFYAPDVYQGTTTVGAATLAFLPKVGGFAALIRVLGFVLEDTARKGLAGDEILGGLVPMGFWFLAVITMTFGNVVALLQDNLKRLLAYSGIAHGGYMLIGLAVAPLLGDRLNVGGVTGLLFYLAAYSAMTLGAFAVIGYLSTPERPVETVDDLAGLGQSHPGIALVMAVFFFSLIGMPLTAGFVGKFLLFLGVFEVPLEESARMFYWLALIAVLNSAVGAWYYLRVIATMYLRPPGKPLEPRRTWPSLAAIWLCAVVTVGLGVYPPALYTQANAATAREAKAARGE